MIDFAHIGLPKSASTLLQSVVFPNHPEITCIGGGQVKHSKEGQPIEDLWLTEPGAYDAEAAKRGFQRLLSCYDTKNTIVGFSEECWSGHGITGHNALLAPERIKRVFGNVKILLILRNPISYIYSQYNQFVKQGGAVTLRSLLDDETFWLKRNIVRKYEYDKLVSRVFELFGKDNTLVLPFEYLRDDASGFCSRIYDFLGVRPVECDTTVANPSVTPQTLAVLRLLNYLDRPRGVRNKVRFASRLDFFVFRRLGLRKSRPSFGDLARMQPLLRDVLCDERFQFWTGELEQYNYTFAED